MNRNYLVLIPVILLSCMNQKANKIQAPKSEAISVSDSLIIVPSEIQTIQKSEEEWKKELDEMSFYVMRKQGTERAFTGEYWDNHKQGVYLCKGCNLPLFMSDTKFESGTGWPSYYQAINKNVIKEHSDHSHGMTRTEVVCARCAGHLGHVFPDGPEPTGLRYCMNSASLLFVENGKIKQ